MREYTVATKQEKYSVKRYLQGTGENYCKWKILAVHGVATSRTQLSDFTFTFHFHALEKEMATHSSGLAWRIPGMGEPGVLPFMGSHRVGHDWSDLAAAAAASPGNWLLGAELCPLVCFPYSHPRLICRSSNTSVPQIWLCLETGLFKK